MSPALQLPALLMAVGVVQGILLSVALFTSKQGHRLANRFLAGCLLAISVDLLQGMLYVSEYIRVAPHLLRVGNPAVFLMGPLFLLYLQALANPNFKWYPRRFGHFIPALLCVFYLVPLYFSSGAEKLAYIEQSYVALPFDAYLLGGLKRLHLGIYIGWMITYLWSIRREEATTSKPALFHLMQAILALWVLVWGIDVYEYLFDFRIVTGIGIVQVCLLAVALILATYAALRYPVVGWQEAASSPKPKYATSTLEPERLDDYAARLEHVMHEEQLYQDGSLTLAKLADRVVLTPHELSQLLNAHFQQNFATFVNHYRVSEAKTRLVDPTYQHLTIAAIAESVGFNSSSSFNAAFKKFTGTTPSRYRKAQGSVVS